MEKQNKEVNTINVTEEVVKEIFIAEIERLRGEEESKKIAGKLFNLMNAKQHEIFEKTLDNFNEEFQRAVRTIFKGGFK